MKLARIRRIQVLLLILFGVNLTFNGGHKILRVDSEGILWVLGRCLGLCWEEGNGDGEHVRG